MSGFEVGDRLGGYELLGVAGEGSMGRVYRALQPRLERVVAVKVIRPELAADDRFRERFRREMRLAAALEHPNILPIYEVGESDGALYAAMRWIAGTNLGQLIAERGALDPAQAVRIAGRVAAALEAAHGIGLVHRDLKPTNVLLEGDRVYVSDFGLATAAEAGAEQLASSAESVHYAAPELLDDRPPDPRTDVYALGCVLYEMLTGSLPFPPERLAVSPDAPGADDPLPASQLRAELPAAIDGVLARAMATSPAGRHRTPGELVRAAEAALGAGAGAAGGRRRARRRRLVALAGAAILTAAAVVVIALETGQSDSGPQAHASSGPVGGRSLPAPASLPACGATLSGPPRDCRSPRGGVNVITDLGKPLHLATINFLVTKVHVGAGLRDPDGASFTAPPGTRFIVLDATVTNVTRTAQRFEPANLTVAGRDTALWLFDKQGKIVSYQGPGGADYSVQFDAVLGTLRTPLSDVSLLPDVPYSGQLVFYYPDTRLQADHRALLEVHELGRGFGYTRTVGGVRLRL